MQQADHIRAHLTRRFHFRCQELLTHELVERFVIKHVYAWQQVGVHDTVRVIKKMLIDLPPVRATFGKSEVVSLVGLSVFPLDQYHLSGFITALKHDDRVRAGEVRSARAISGFGRAFTQVILCPDPLKGNVKPIFNGDHVVNLRENQPQQVREFFRSICKRKQKVDARDLGIAQVIAGFAILTLMPANVVYCEKIHGGLPDWRIEVFLRILHGQAKRSGLAFEQAFSPGLF